MSITKKWQFYLADPLSPNNLVLVDQVEGSKPRPWAKHRKYTEIISKSYLRLSDLHPDLIKKYQALSSCGTWLKFSECGSGCVDGRQLIGASFCRQRLCPMCQWRRSLLVAGQVAQVCQEVNCRQPVRFLFLTLTVRNCSGSDLPETITHLNKSFSKLMRRKRISSYVLGSFRGFEVTAPDSNSYHPHLHVLLAVSPSYFKSGFIKQAEWVQLWSRAAGLNYKPVVDVRAVKPGKGGLPGAAAESAKYAVKPSDLIGSGAHEPMDRKLEILHFALHGRRSYAYTGVMKEIHNELFALDPEDQEHDLTDPVERCTCPRCGNDLAERVFKWAADRQLYVSKPDKKREFHNRVDQAVDSWRGGRRGL